MRQHRPSFVLWRKVRPRWFRAVFFVVSWLARMPLTVVALVQGCSVALTSLPVVAACSFELLPKVTTKPCGVSCLAALPSDLIVNREIAFRNSDFDLRQARA